MSKRVSVRLREAGASNRTSFYLAAMRGSPQRDGSSSDDEVVRHRRHRGGGAPADEANPVVDVPLQPPPVLIHVPPTPPPPPPLPAPSSSSVVRRTQSAAARVRAHRTRHSQNERQAQLGRNAIAHREQYAVQRRRVTTELIFLGDPSPCRYGCGALLFPCEAANAICCGKGTCVPSERSNVPDQLMRIYDTRGFSDASRAINNQLAFAATGTTGAHGYIYRSRPSVIVVQGRTYHFVKDILHDNTTSPFWWVSDPTALSEQRRPHLSDNSTSAAWPQSYVQWGADVLSVLKQVNPFAQRFLSMMDALHRYESSHQQRPDYFQISDRIASNEIASVFFSGNLGNDTPPSRHCVSYPLRPPLQNEPTCVSVSMYSRFYEVLTYPLIFPDGRGGWFRVEDRPGSQSIRSTTGKSLTQHKYLRYQFFAKG